MAKKVNRKEQPKKIKVAKKSSVIKSKKIVKAAKSPKPKTIIKKSQEPERTRYNNQELQEFKGIILKKMEDAKKELQSLHGSITHADDHGTDDTATSIVKVLEDGSDTLAKEEAAQLASRQKRFIQELENALIRIENKTYGLCRVTGKLIPKERLRMVPHTTQSMEAKLKQYQ